MAYWAARETAVVLFLNFHRPRRTWHPTALMATFTRQDREWKPDTHWHGTSFHDPFSDPGGRYGLGGRPIASSGGLGGIICHGTAAPAVKYLALIQDGHQDRRPLDNHFGAWVICAERPGAVAVAALDENGTTLARRSRTDRSLTGASRRATGRNLCACPGNRTYRWVCCWLPGVAEGVNNIGEPFDVRSPCGFRRRPGCRRPFEVRWHVRRPGPVTVVHHPGASADGSRAELLRAARQGLDFSTRSRGTASSAARLPATISWLDHAAAYAARKWPLAAAHTRAAIARWPNSASPRGQPSGPHLVAAAGIVVPGRPAVSCYPAEVQTILAEVTRICPELTAFFGCLYYAALRPAEAVATPCHILCCGWPPAPRPPRSRARAGHSVRVLLAVYAHCIPGCDQSPSIGRGIPRWALRADEPSRPVRPLLALPSRCRQPGRRVTVQGTPQRP